MKLGTGLLELDPGLLKLDPGLLKPDPGLLGQEYRPPGPRIQASGAQDIGLWPKIQVPKISLRYAKYGLSLASGTLKLGLWDLDPGP